MSRYVSWTITCLVLSMPNLSSVLKSEITRLARKEIKSAVAPIRKANMEHRQQLSELKRQVASLQRGSRTFAEKSKRGAEVAIQPGVSTRFVPKGVKALRGRLGLSAADFGLLVGASGQSVYNWEAGKSVPRGAQQAKLAAIRGLGKREAAKRLQGLAEA